MIRIFKDEVDITSDVCEALYSSIRDIGVKVEIANEIVLTGTEIIQCNIEQQILTEDKFNLGTANCATCELVINNIDEPYDPEYFIGQEIKAYYTLTTAKNDYVEIPMGLFVVDTAIRNTNKIKISAYDRVLLTEENYDSNTEMTFPATLKQIAEDACSISKVPFSNSDFFNSDIEYKDMVVFGNNTTCRNVLQNVAEMACGYLQSDRYGKLLIKSLDTETIVDTIYPKNYFKIDQLEQEFGPIKSVYIVYDEEDSLYGEGSPQLQIRDNYYTPKDFNYLSEKIYNHISNIEYNPATLEWQGNPLFDVGDFINVIDKKGNVKKLLIANQKFTFGGGLKCVIKSVGKSDVALATEKKNVISESIEGLNRKLNMLKSKIDKAEIDLIMTELQEYSDRVDGLIEEVKEVQINITPNGIINTVTNSKEYQDNLNGIYDGLNGLAGQTVNMESLISQQADQINMSVKVDNIISSINMDKSGVQIQGEKIKLKGVVTFENLSNEGETVINGGNIKTGTISGDRIVGGTIEGINIKGEVVDVTAKLSVSPENDATRLYAPSDTLYPEPENKEEWSTIDFNILTKSNETKKERIIDTVKLKVYPYGVDNYNRPPEDKFSNPQYWKYGLEVNGAMKIIDDLIIEGQNGLVITGEQGLKTPVIRTDLVTNSYKGGVVEITRLNSISPGVPQDIGENLNDDPFIYFDMYEETSGQNRTLIETHIESDKTVYINSTNKKNYPSLETENIYLRQSYSGGSPGNTGIYTSSSSKIYTEGTLEIYNTPDITQKLGNIKARSIKASGYVATAISDNGFGSPDNGTFLLPVYKKTEDSSLSGNVFEVEPIFNMRGGNGTKPMYTITKYGTEVCDSTTSINNKTYYACYIKLDTVMKKDDLQYGEDFGVVVSSNTVGSSVYWNKNYKSSDTIQIVSEKNGVEFSYTMFSKVHETKYVNVDYSKGLEEEE